MPSGTHAHSLSVSGTVFTRSQTKTADAANVSGDAAAPITLPVGKTVTGWTKTDADTASCTLPSGHGFTSGKFDVYDSDGDIIRYGVDGTVAGNALTLDGGTVGEDYPSGFPASATTGIVVNKQLQVNVNIDGDLAALIGIELATVHGHVDLQDASSVSVVPYQLYAGEPRLWDSSMKRNPFSGNVITKVMASNGNASSTGALRLAVLQDSTVWPSASPSATPSASPSATPSASPSATPSASPSATPSSSPSATPSSSPSAT